MPRLEHSKILTIRGIKPRRNRRFRSRHRLKTYSTSSSAFFPSIEPSSGNDDDLGDLNEIGKWKGGKRGESEIDSRGKIRGSSSPSPLTQVEETSQQNLPNLRKLPDMISAKILGFWTPSPPCPHLELIYTIIHATSLPPSAFP